MHRGIPEKRKMKRKGSEEVPATKSRQYRKGTISHIHRILWLSLPSSRFFLSEREGNVNRPPALAKPVHKLPANCPSPRSRKARDFSSANA